MDEADYRVVQNAAAALAEFFDTVQIFVTKHNGDGSGTGHATAGRGNWFARRGQVGEWMVKEDQKAEIEALESMEEPAEDDDDEEKEPAAE